MWSNTWSKDCGMTPGSPLGPCIVCVLPQPGRKAGPRERGARARHGAAATQRTGLPVGEDGAVVALQHGLHQRVRSLLVHRLLRALVVVDAVKGEGLAAESGPRKAADRARARAASGRWPAREGARTLVPDGPVAPLAASTPWGLEMVTEERSRSMPMMFLEQRVSSCVFMGRDRTTTCTAEGCAAGPGPGPGPGPRQGLASKRRKQRPAP